MRQNQRQNDLAQSAGATPLHRNHLHKECPVYDTKQSDSEASVMMELWGMRSNPFIAITPRSTLAGSDSTW